MPNIITEERNEVLAQLAEASGIALPIVTYEYADYSLSELREALQQIQGDY